MMEDEIESELFSARVLNKLGPHSKKEKKNRIILLLLKQIRQSEYQLVGKF